MLSFVFPGQGSQAVGMGRYLVENFPIAKRTFEEASDSISINMEKLCFSSSDTDLAMTENTQPAIVCVSAATARVLLAESQLRPRVSAGHSVGEYAALVTSGVMSFKDAMRAVRLRGKLMQEAVPAGEGGMMAVLGLEPEQCAYLCNWVEKTSGLGPLAPANFNSPGQIVISGSTKALEWLKTHFAPEVLPGQPKRAKLIGLNVSAPFHCSLMQPAEEKMKTFLQDIEFKTASSPIIQNCNAEEESEAAKMRLNLIRQISAPVLWTQTMEKMRQIGISQIIECGHGSVLRGLFKKFDAENFTLAGSNSIDEIKATMLIKL